MRQCTLRTPLRSRKGSLSLSINAIVIIVLAMTLLGLGLGFIRNLFKGIGETTATVQDQVKQQIIDDLRTGDKRLSFSANKLNIQRGTDEVTAFGVKNSKNTGPLNFAIFVEALKKEGLTPADSLSCARNVPQYFNFASGTGISGATWSCKDSVGDPVEGKIDGIDFFFDEGPDSLSLDESKVIPITITGKEKGKYLVKLSILEDSEEIPDQIYGETPQDNSNPSTPQENEIYASKTFFINVI